MADARRWRALVKHLEVHPGLLIFDGPNKGQRKHYLMTTIEASVMLPAAEPTPTPNTLVDVLRNAARIRLAEMAEK